MGYIQGKIKQRIKEIEKEMKELFPKKEMAYNDYINNVGSDELTYDHLWEEFRELRDRWNRLVVERKELLEKTN